MTNKPNDARAELTTILDRFHNNLMFHEQPFDNGPTKEERRKMDEIWEVALQAIEAYANTQKIRLLESLPKTGQVVDGKRIEYVPYSEILHMLGELKGIRGNKCQRH